MNVYILAWAALLMNLSGNRKISLVACDLDGQIKFDESVNLHFVMTKQSQIWSSLDLNYFADIECHDNIMMIIYKMHLIYDTSLILTISSQLP